MVSITDVRRTQAIFKLTAAPKTKPGEKLIWYNPGSRWGGIVGSDT